MNTGAVKDKSGATPDETRWSPYSKYQEPISIPFLTLFDMNREPRKLSETMSSDIISRDIDPLKQLFTCPICLGYIKKTYIVMECLHRFCSDCVQKCLRVGKKECPSCRLHIPSRRSLRPNTAYDDLIVKIFGDIKAMEEDEDTAIEAFNKMHSTVTRRTSKEIKRKATHSPREDRENKRKINTDHILNYEPSPLVDFILRPHPLVHDLERLNRESIRTSKDIKISNLCRFLSKKLDLNVPIQILIRMGSIYVTLEDDVSIETISSEVLNQKEEDSILTLYYKRGDTSDDQELHCDSRDNL